MMLEIVCTSSLFEMRKNYYTFFYILAISFKNGVFVIKISKEFTV
jgi:hypothetical protein